MRRLFALAACVLAFALAVLPVFAGFEFTLAASAARTVAGTGTAVDVSRCRTLNVLVNVTAGSGTVSLFKVFLEGTVDGTNFMELPCAVACKDAGACTASTQNVVSETTVQTSSMYAAVCDIGVDEVRAAWNITGTTPSETFTVEAACK